MSKPADQIPIASSASSAIQPPPPPPLLPDQATPLLSPPATLFTPLNLLLLSLLLLTAYIQLRPLLRLNTSNNNPLPPPPRPTVFKTFTPRSLAPYTGGRPVAVPGSSSSAADDDTAGATAAAATPDHLKPGAQPGGQPTPVYVAVLGNVYDVTPGARFYGPSGPYAVFAGRDASRLLAKGSLDEEDLGSAGAGAGAGVGPGGLDRLEDLNDEEWEALRGWEETFRGKYTVVGRLVGESEEAGVGKVGEGE